MFRTSGRFYIREMKATPREHWTDEFNECQLQDEIVSEVLSEAKEHGGE